MERPRSAAPVVFNGGAGGGGGGASSRGVSPSKSINNVIVSSATATPVNEINGVERSRSQQRQMRPTIEPSPQRGGGGAFADRKLPSINAYPEIKICEFFGYPSGTQLGLVVTSDEYSHDVVKVADESPASRAGIMRGDVIIAVNDINVEGNPNSIELLNEFNEFRPLKILLASRYAYEWSKLLNIRIVEKDWPNIKKFSTRHIPIPKGSVNGSGQMASTSGVNLYANNNSINSTVNSSNVFRPVQAANASIYAPSNYYEQTAAAAAAAVAAAAAARSSSSTAMRSSGRVMAATPTAMQQHMAGIQPSPTNNTAYYRSTSATPSLNAINYSLNSNNNNNINNNQFYSEVQAPSLRMPVQSSNKRIISSASTVRSANTDQMSVLSVLSRSAIDITADGKVLRMCSLTLDPSSPNPTDAEFGFDLITKIGRNNLINQNSNGAANSSNIVNYYGRTVGDYYIDTVDDNSPASLAGLKPGDRLVEVDGIDVTNKSFEQVVQLINEAKLRSKLKLLVYPSVVINYGNPNVSADSGGAYHHHQQQQLQQTKPPMQIYEKNQQLGSISYNDSRSMPDLTFQQQQQQQQQQHLFNQSQNIYRAQNVNVKQSTNSSEYGSLYNARNNNNLVSKSNTNLYGGDLASYTDLSNLAKPSDLLRPVPRLCTIYKNDSMYIQPSQSSSNIGFGIQTKQTSPILPNYMRVSIVNYKSPAYLAGLDAGDYIIEINGRNTASMTYDEALHFIKSSYELNNYVKLLVISEFSYNWLKENNSMSLLSSDNPGIFSYSDYLKNNHRYVPRLCKIKLYPFSKSFGFALDTLLIRPSSTLVSANKAAAYQSYAHIITKVDKDSPAYTSGLLKGDRIVECDGINVEAENERQIIDRIHQAFYSSKQITLFTVDPDSDNFFKSKCIKLHSMLPIVQHITNSTDI
jgi:C-terminal processing protease CtpA/Prc